MRIPVTTILNDVIAKLNPRVRQLSIQLDGASENWNKVALGFCNMLVSCGRFDEIQLCSEFGTFLVDSTVLTNAYICSGLPVGHTHEDIDQIFSIISRALLGGPKRDVEVTLNTREELSDFLSTKVMMSLQLLDQIDTDVQIPSKMQSRCLKVCQFP